MSPAEGVAYWLTFIGLALLFGAAIGLAQAVYINRKRSKVATVEFQVYLFPGKGWRWCLMEKETPALIATPEGQRYFPSKLAAIRAADEAKAAMAAASVKAEEE